MRSLQGLGFCVTATIVTMCAVTPTDAGTVLLTSNQASTCPDEVAYYRCIATNGTQLAWEISSATDSGVIVFADSSLIGSSKSQFDGFVWALLVEQTSSVFESILSIRPSPSIPSANVTCTTSGSRETASYITASQPSVVTGLKYEASNVSWEAPQVRLDSTSNSSLVFYEVYAFGKDSFDDQIFQVLETFAYVNSTMFLSVNVTVQNSCGQRSRSVRINLSAEAFTKTWEFSTTILMLNYMTMIVLLLALLVMIHIILLRFYRGSSNFAANERTEHALLAHAKTADLTLKEEDSEY